MFIPIDFATWDRKEIYERFDGYTYCVTAEVDITHMLAAIRQKERKFYPSMCYCIARMVNEQRDYRFGKMEGKVGYWDHVDAHYTLMRRHTNHLFTQTVTRYQPFEAFYQAFLVDKERAEECDQLYYHDYSPLDTVHISILPRTHFRSLSYSKPARFTGYGAQNTSYIPFVTMGQYLEKPEGVKLPVTAELHHNVNDGYHAERFFLCLAESCERLAQELAED